MATDDEQLGERIRQRRVELGLTQSQLGDRRYSKGYVSLVECGKLPPSRDALLHFAAQLDLPGPLQVRRKIRLDRPAPHRVAAVRGPVLFILDFGFWILDWGFWICDL